MSRKRTLAAVTVAALTGVGLMAVPASAEDIPQEGDVRCVDGIEETYMAVLGDPERSEWRTEAPDGDGWEIVDTRLIPAETETQYLAGFYEQTDWVLESPGEDWVQIAERTVVTQEHVPGEYEQTGWLLGPPDDDRDWVQIAERWVWDVEPSTETIEHDAVYGEREVQELVKEAWTETVKDAYWQRYSWTGPNTDTPPTFPGPNWQANTKSDPHQYDAEGVYPRGGGNGWFALEWSEAVTVDHPAEYKTVTETYLVEEAWTETVEHEGEGHKEFKYAWHVPEVPEVSHQEYKFAKHVAPEWMTEVPDGWIVKEEREVEITEAYEEHIFERVVPVLDWVAGDPCPIPEPGDGGTGEETPEPEEPTSETSETPVTLPVSEEETVEPVEPADESPSPTEAEVPAAVEAAPEQADRLAQTGVGTGLAVLSAALLASGGVLTAAARRRK